MHLIQEKMATRSIPVYVDTSVPKIGNPPPPYSGFPNKGGCKYTYLCYIQFIH